MTNEEALENLDEITGRFDSMSPGVAATIAHIRALLVAPQKPAPKPRVKLGIHSGSYFFRFENVTYEFPGRNEGGINRGLEVKNLLSHLGIEVEERREADDEE